MNGIWGPLGVSLTVFFGLLTLIPKSRLKIISHLKHWWVIFKINLSLRKSTLDQRKDVLNFIELNRDLMKPEELATRQLEQQIIRVVSWRPLEVDYPEVLESTITWLQKNERTEDSRIEFWIPSSRENSPYVKQLIGELIAATTTNIVKKRVKIIVAPDDFFAVDYTVWANPEASPKAFANDSGTDNQNYLLWKLIGDAPTRLDLRLDRLLKIGSKKSVKYELSGKIISIPQHKIDQTTLLG